MAKPTIATLTFGAAMAFGWSQAGAAPATPSPICALLDTVVGAMPSEEGAGFDGTRPPSAVLLPVLKRPLPREFLQTAAEPAADLNPFTLCAELAKHLPSGAHMATLADLDAVKSARSSPGVNVDWISLPIFDRAKQSALVWTGRQCPGLCGQAELFVYRRVHDAWVRDSHYLVRVDS